ncbi:DUF885 domain-containing protein [Pseudonocardia sp. KRD-184]|uniref:DUF885 domain-containing protein n=1 Tax=Pseudonocardia oceani TaxID=2792013 RepID=A0ABS6UBP9_9PSEU|nr:DUF885 domain-containing protein [Pseudonocardia oceani]MBW0092561.1 DUF885 domain-containing protein [Pseudonocardia oceani]MBW0099293.1 DUF885 domain-containing protein [Pseudonocardia oceani]MBW0111803.1 DUF885 domain-containing protein [Pseudonocardia oceani]MBW0125418.1 DUF885 domain-containing protein [Pseudonocardia oceani]MBW0129667.1 DUF885 domain-containing protein [Pseudonocardia oceani]
MPVDEAVRDYLSLALAIGRRRSGTVGVRTGDAPAPAGPPPSPGALVRAAGRLGQRLPDLGLEPRRERFLAAQLVALESAARRLAGQGVPYDAVLAAAADGPVAPGREDDHRAAHRELDALLPGSGGLAARLAEHRRRDDVPPDRLAAGLAAMAEALRARARDAGLVDGPEEVVFEVVADAPWSALHRREGPGRSRVLVHAGARPRRAGLARLVAHEAYPGHHVEQWRREAVLLGERGWAEHGVVLLGTPQALLSEGAADNGLHALVGPGWGPWASDVLDGVGLGFDGERDERVAAAVARLARVRLDAARLRRAGARADDVEAFLRRWLLVDDRGARRVLRFLSDPRWRDHVVTYVEGVPLARRWLDHPGATPAQRLRELYDGAWTPSGLREELSRMGRE